MLFKDWIFKCIFLHTGYHSIQLTDRKQEKKEFKMIELEEANM